MTKKQSGSVVKVAAYQDFSLSAADSFSENYHGLPVHALDGLHAFVAEKGSDFIAPGGSVLDLGAGSGAMSQRLTDMGLRVTASDIVAENFRLHQKVPFIAADLNEDFSDSFEGDFDAITAVEIIEHLENPRKFLRQCSKLLKDGGYLLLSSPNIDNPVAKGMFLKSGIFQWFTDYNYENDGHIMPISQWMLKKIVHETQFSIAWIGTFGDPCKAADSLVLRAAARVIGLLSSCRRDMAGEITVAVLRKQNC